MARQQTTCHSTIELLEAVAIFVTAIGMAALAVVGFCRNPSAAIAVLGGLPTAIFVTIGCCVCSDALRNRRASLRACDDGEDDESLRGLATSGHDERRQEQRAFIGLPATALARLQVCGSGDGADSGGEECAACLGSLVDGADTTVQLPECRHVFHRQCLGRWLLFHWTCPICRRVVRRAPVSSQEGSSCLISS